MMMEDHAINYVILYKISDEKIKFFDQLYAQLVHKYKFSERIVYAIKFFDPVGINLQNITVV
jgi:hypothetical protein